MQRRALAARLISWIAMAAFMTAWASGSVIQIGMNAHLTMRTQMPSWCVPKTRVRNLATTASALFLVVPWHAPSWHPPGLSVQYMIA